MLLKPKKVQFVVLKSTGSFKKTGEEIVLKKKRCFWSIDICIALFFPILEQLCGKPDLKRVNLKLRSLANHESIRTQLKKITLTFSRKLLNVLIFFFVQTLYGTRLHPNFDGH